MAENWTAEMVHQAYTTRKIPSMTTSGDNWTAEMVREAYTTRRIPSSAPRPQQVPALPAVHAPTPLKMQAPVLPLPQLKPLGTPLAPPKVPGVPVYTPNQPPKLPNMPALPRYMPRADTLPLNERADAFIKSTGSAAMSGVSSAMDYMGNLLVKSSQERLNDRAEYGKMQAQIKQNPALGMDADFMRRLTALSYTGAPLNLALRKTIDPVLSKLDPTQQSTATQLFQDQQQQGAEKFKSGLSPLQSVVADVGLAGANTALTFALSSALGIPYLAMIGTQTGAEAGQKALNEGHSAAKSAAFALGSGGISAGVESFGGIGGNMGSKLLGKFAPKVSAYVAKLPMTTLRAIFGNALSEGAEEFTEYGLQLGLENLMLDKNTPYNIRIALYNAGIGAAVGGMFGGAKSIGSAKDAVVQNIDNSIDNISLDLAPDVEPVDVITEPPDGTLRAKGQVDYYSGMRGASSDAERARQIPVKPVSNLPALPAPAQSARRVGVIGENVSETRSMNPDAPYDEMNSGPAYRVGQYLEQIKTLQTPEEIATYRQGLDRQLYDLESIRMKAVDSYADYIYHYKGDGVALVPTGNGEQRIRVSQNEPWYSKYAGRQLSRADARALAERVVNTPKMQADFPDVAQDGIMDLVNSTGSMVEDLRYLRDEVLTSGLLHVASDASGYTASYGTPARTLEGGTEFVTPINAVMGGRPDTLPNSDNQQAERGIPQQQEISALRQNKPVVADLSLFDRNVLSDFNAARKNVIAHARTNFPDTVVNRETQIIIGISRHGMDKLLSGNLTPEKYASAFHVPELIENAKHIATVPNAKPKPGLGEYSYFDSPISINGQDYVAHIRVRATDMGQKYYGHTVSDMGGIGGMIDEIRIEPSARSSTDESALHPVKSLGSIDFNVPQGVNNVNRHGIFGLDSALNPMDNVDGGEFDGGQGQRSNRPVSADGERGLPHPYAVIAGRTEASGEYQAIDSESLGRKWQTEKESVEILTLAGSQYRIKATSPEQITSNARDTVRLLQQFGIEPTVSGEKIIVKKGEQYFQTEGIAQTLKDGRVLLYNHHDYAPANVANHEAIHVAKVKYPDIYASISDTIAESGIKIAANGKLPAAIDKMIGAYVKTHPSIQYVDNFDLFYNELAAQIAGLNSIDPAFTRAQFGDAFYDYDSVLASIENGLAEMKRRAAQGGGTNGYGRNTVGAAQSAFPHKQKLSKVRGNTIENSTMFSAADKEMLKPSDYQYDVIGERQTMAEAQQRLQLDFDGEAETLLNKTSLNGADGDTGMGILEQYMAKAKEIGKGTPESERAITWLKKFQPRVTDAGQLIQSLDKYSRTPQGAAIKALKLSGQESELAQMLGENKMSRSDIPKEFDAGKIEQAMLKMRDEIYPQLLDIVNNVLVQNGYKPIAPRKNYFPHFNDSADPLVKAFAKLGFKIDLKELPTDIAGLTASFKPGKQWFGNFLQRRGDTTVYDALRGFDQYIDGISNVIYHTEDLQRLRRLEAAIRLKYSQAGVDERIQHVLDDSTLDEGERQEQLSELYKQDLSHLGKFAVELRSYTDSLAGKKDIHDRSMENDIGRISYSIMDAMEKHVSANMVGMNISSALTNFIALTQGGAEVSTPSMVKGIADTLGAWVHDDGFANDSTFITNRNGSQRLVNTGLERLQNVTSKPFELIDGFTVGALTRARNYDNLKKGMSTRDALRDADAWAASVVGDRSKGALPTIFNRKNPIEKIFLMFQVETNNQLSHIFKDIPRDEANKKITHLAMILAKYAIASYLFNDLYEKLVGRRPALDVIGTANQAVGDFSGKKLPNTVDLVSDSINGKPISFDVQKKGLTKAGTNLATNIAEQLPFVGGVLGGGRVPIQGAIPNVQTIWNAASNDELPGNVKTARIGKELLKPVYYGLMPFGGGQLKKNIRGHRYGAKRRLLCAQQ